MLNCLSFRFATLLPVSQEGMEARSSLQSKQKLELPDGWWSIGHAGSEVLAKPKVESTSKAGKYPGPLLSLFCRKRRLHFSLDSGKRVF